MSLIHLAVTLDCVDLDQMGTFWSQALGFDGLEREGDYLLLRGPGNNSGVRGFTLQQVPEPKATKNRMHFDVVVDDVGPEVERLQALGAVVLAIEDEPTAYEAVVMADPEGNEFCVIKARAAD